MNNPLPAFFAVVEAEILFNFRRIAPWALMALFCLNAVVWWQGASVAYGWAPNSDYYIVRLFSGFTFLTTPFFVAMLLGDPVIRDFRLEAAPLLLSAPIGRAGYLLGKFAGNFLVLLACDAVFALTLVVLQGASVERMIVLPWRIRPYIWHFLFIICIPHLTLGAFCFMVGTLGRSLRLLYGLVAASYAFYIAVMVAIRNVAPRSTTRLDERPASEVNRAVIAYDADLIVNRLFMLGLAALFLLIVYLRFGRSAGGGGIEVERSSAILLGLDAPSERLVAESAPAVVLTEAETVAAREAVVIAPAAVFSRVAVADLPSPGWRMRLLQFVAATGAEFRLLRAERSLIILVPLVIVLTSLEFSSFNHLLGAPFFPVSSIYAPGSVGALLLLLGGVTIFYTGEMMHRDRELRVESMLWSAPVPNWILLCSKPAAVFGLALGIIFLTALTGMALQLYRGAVFDPQPYIVVYGVILLPSLVFLGGATVALNVLLRDKYLADAAGVALGGAMIYLFSRGHLNWLWNPVLHRLWIYSDMTGLEPYRVGLWLHRIYWLAITAAGLALAHGFFRRRDASRFKTMMIAAAAVIVALAAGLAINREIDRGAHRDWWTGALVRYEQRFRGRFHGAPQPEWARIDLRVELVPARHEFRAGGEFELVNRTQTPIESVLLTLNPDLEWRRVEISGAAQPQADELVRVYRLDAPLPPGGRAMLRVEWEGVIPRGLLKYGAVQSAFIGEGGTFLGAADVVWLPTLGYVAPLEIADAETRRRHGLPPREWLPELKDAVLVPNERQNQNLPYDLHLEITVPADQTAISSGRLTAVKDEGARRTFVYESEYPVMRFPILAARLLEARRRDLAVYHHPSHGFNVGKMLDALEAARSQYERDYAPLPARDLRIVEYPRLMEMLVSYPTTIAWSEAHFLVREDTDEINAVYFGVAHEVAHQWFGGLVQPGRSRGAQVLSEGLAQYAAGALLDEALGERAGALLRRYEEREYLNRRDPGFESPLIGLDDSHPSHRVIGYQKAGLVFHMLETLIGRGKMNSALRDYIACYAGQPRHPTIHDLLSILKRQTPDNRLDWFYEQWFERIVVPDFRIVSASVRSEGGEYRIEFMAENAGEGRMPVRIEAVAGDERDAAGFRSAATTVVIEAGRQTKASIRCPFRPERLVIDRRYEIIDGDRLSNDFRF